MATWRARGTAWLRGDEGQAALALLYTAVALTVLEYRFLPTTVEAGLRGLPPHAVPPPSLRAGLTWALGTIGLYVVPPTLLVLLVQRRSLASIGWSPRGFVRHLPVYLGLFALMVPALVVVARRPDFLTTYPFVSEARTDARSLLLWELAYLAQFVALEAFFRGYLLFTLERAVGRLAVYAMVVPYCMIHYHKPMPEALGAVVAGVVLGHLALRYRSFWGGALLHGLVALSMDLLSAHRAGLF